MVQEARVRWPVEEEHNLALVLILLLFMVELLVLVLLHNHAILKFVLVPVFAHHQKIILPPALQVRLAPSTVFLLNGPGLVPALAAHLLHIVRRRELRDTLDINFSTENTKKFPIWGIFWYTIANAN